MSKFKRTIAVTGGAGFIGSNLLRRLVDKYPDSRFVNLDKLTYAGNPANVADFHDSPNYNFEEVDLCDFEKLSALFAMYNFDGVIHLAAESHVDRSIKGPAPFVMTNVLGTFNLLEQFRSTGKKGRNIRLLHVSTDEVYGSSETDFFNEESAYHPSSPYAAAKASADHLVRSYVKTYGLDCVISNCSNNYGPYQHPEKFIPTVIRHALAGEKIPVYGDGQNVRDWIHVDDHCAALDLIFHRGEQGESYSVGSRCEKVNLDLAVSICRIVDELQGGDRREELIELVVDRPGHDRRYALDASKVEHELRWKPRIDFDHGLRDTVQWYIDHQPWVKKSLQRTEALQHGKASE